MLFAVFRTCAGEQWDDLTVEQKQLQKCGPVSRLLQFLQLRCVYGLPADLSIRSCGVWETSRPSRTLLSTVQQQQQLLLVPAFAITCQSKQLHVYFRN